MGRVIPVVFRAPRSLRALNVSAVGFAIAACTSAAFIAADPMRWRWSILAGLPTVIVGSVWAAMLRGKATVAGRVPVGWVLSIPFAALNAGLACGLAFLWDTPQTPMSFFGGLVLGATFGAIIWVPALVSVLVLFGLPIRRAQKLAERGLAGEERGEAIVGATCAILSVLAWLLARAVALPHPDALGVIVFHALALLGGSFGVLATVVALRREARRRKFVERVEAEQEPGLRVEETTLGKMLVRVDTQVETYRVARAPDEELIELDQEGRAVRAMR